MTAPPPELRHRLQKLQTEHEDLQQALKDLQRSQSNFLSVVSHELRVPLTAIKGYTDLLRQGTAGEINAQQHAFLDVIANNVERMGALITGLVDLARLENGELQIERTAVPTLSAIRQAAESAKLQFLEKEQKFTLSLPAGLPPVLADAERLQQVLRILLDNAARYTGPGGQITLRALETEGHLLVEVSDSGIGIAEEDQPRLFEAFFRSEDPRVRDQQGWGLGLSLAKGLVEKMGGGIGAHSEPDEGAVFWMTLPTA